MKRREPSNQLWERLTQWLDSMGQELDQRVAEAARQFAAAPDRPLGTAIMHKLVTTAVERKHRAACRDEGGLVLTDWVYATQANSRGDLSESDAWLDALSDQLCGIERRAGMLLEQWTTKVDSATVDAGTLPRAKGSEEQPASIAGESLVVDACARPGELAARTLRKLREATLYRDVALEARPSALLKWALACSTSFDFIDYDDQTMKDLLWN